MTSLLLCWLAVALDEPKPEAPAQAVRKVLDEQNNASLPIPLGCPPVE